MCTVYYNPKMEKSVVHHRKNAPWTFSQKAKSEKKSLTFLFLYLCRSEYELDDTQGWDFFDGLQQKKEKENRAAPKVLRPAC